MGSNPTPTANLNGCSARELAPDYPGTGHSDAPAATVLRSTFDDVARVIDEYCDAIAAAIIERFSR